ncbi:hypothetical protein WME76_22715 [Sorangium sp. So ce119]|uniref:hypothetical protein n=1 Tax=Sorangium sp. So ce119 TaxID=3133279 RepID=UPI003F60DA41
MPESLLDDDNIGFCTLIETTKSSLFARGCNLGSEAVQSEDFWFCVCVPTTESPTRLELFRLIEEAAGRVPRNLRDATPILVEIQRDDPILAWTSERQAKLASSLVNRFLRAYEHTYFDVSVPRHILDGRPVVLITPESCRALAYTPKVLDLNEALIHYLPGHQDIEQAHLSFLMGSPDLMTPSWRIVIDGVRHFESGNMREAVLCAVSAAEILASPAVERWLQQMTLSGGGDGLRNAVREMGNPFRFELCLSTVCSRAFADVSQQEKLELLTQLRNMNSLRNRVVHAGEEPDPDAAAAALRTAARFVCKIWLAEFETDSANSQ